jgi:hypothetical protein
MRWIAIRLALSTFELVGLFCGFIARKRGAIFLREKSNSEENSRGVGEPSGRRTASVSLLRRLRTSSCISSTAQPLQRALRLRVPDEIKELLQPRSPAFGRGVSAFSGAGALHPCGTLWPEEDQRQYYRIVTNRICMYIAIT